MYSNRAVHQLEVKETIICHDFSMGPSYVVADYQTPWIRFGPPNDDPVVANVTRRVYEIVEWRAPGQDEPKYFAIEAEKRGLLNVLAQVTQDQYRRSVEEVVEREKARWVNTEGRDIFAKGVKIGVDQTRVQIRNMPWWKRLFNQF